MRFTLARRAFQPAPHVAYCLPHVYRRIQLAPAIQVPVTHGEWMLKSWKLDEDVLLRSFGVELARRNRLFSNTYTNSITNTYSSPLQGKCFKMFESV